LIVRKNAVNEDGRKNDSMDMDSSLDFDTETRAFDASGASEVSRAIAQAVAALADTLNALGLRIALSRDNSSAEGDLSTAHYNRLATLTKAAAGQVRGIQLLLGTLDDNPVRERSEGPEPPERSWRSPSGL
jgi:hypothetical protein